MRVQSVAYLNAQPRQERFSPIWLRLGDCFVATFPILRGRIGGRTMLALVRLGHLLGLGGLDLWFLSLRRSRHLRIPVGGQRAGLVLLVGLGRIFSLDDAGFDQDLAELVGEHNLRDGVDVAPDVLLGLSTEGQRGHDCNIMCIFFLLIFNSSL